MISGVNLIFCLFGIDFLVLLYWRVCLVKLMVWLMDCINCGVIFWILGLLLSFSLFDKSCVFVKMFLRLWLILFMVVFKVVRCDFCWSDVLMFCCIVDSWFLVFWILKILEEGFMICVVFCGFVLNVVMFLFSFFMGWMSMWCSVRKMRNFVSIEIVSER